MRTRVVSIDTHTQPTSASAAITQTEVPRRHGGGAPAVRVASGGWLAAAGVKGRARGDEMPHFVLGSPGAVAPTILRFGAVASVVLGSATRPAVSAESKIWLWHVLASRGPHVRTRRDLPRHEGRTGYAW